MLARRFSVCISTAIAVGFLAAAPARADKFVDVAVLEAQVEAAAELAELPTEPDWGVPDHPNSLPMVPQDAPEVPAAPSPAAGAAAEPQYQVAEPQYHAEYHAPQADPAPQPVAEPAPVTAADPAPAAAAPAPADASEKPAQAPATPVPPQAPAVPQSQSAPTVWIWIWNWTWVQGSDGRYRNSDEQYQIEAALPELEIPRIIKEIGAQIPVQIGVQIGSDIADDIVKDIASGSAPPLQPPPAAAPTPVVPLDGHRAAPQRYKGKPASPRRHSRSSAALERPHTAASLSVAASVPPAQKTSGPAPATRRAESDGEPPRARRASRRAPSLPLPGERLADSAAASGASASLLKTIAVLALSLLLAAFGHGRRIWLPAARWRGLLGTRTDPPG